jgi:hypothetical protein
MVAPDRRDRRDRCSVMRGKEDGATTLPPYVDNQRRAIHRAEASIDVTAARALFRNPREM